MSSDTWHFYSTDRGVLQALIAVDLPLPDAQTVVDGAKSMAFAQILPYFAAIVGFYLTYLLVKSFVS